MHTDWVLAGGKQSNSAGQVCCGDVRGGLSVRTGLSALGGLGSRSALQALQVGVSRSAGASRARLGPCCLGSQRKRTRSIAKGARGAWGGVSCLAGLAHGLSHDASNFSHVQCPAMGRRKIAFRNFL